MSIFGIILIVLAAPLLIGYFVGEKKNVSWRNLGAIMAIVGVVILFIPR